MHQCCAVLVAFCGASIAEMHQSFLSPRSASMKETLIPKLPMFSSSVFAPPVSSYTDHLSLLAPSDVHYHNVVFPNHPHPVRHWAPE